jgi:hypothetical protein
VPQHPVLEFIAAGLLQFQQLHRCARSIYCRSWLGRHKASDVTSCILTFPSLAPGPTLSTAVLVQPVAKQHDADKESRGHDVDDHVQLVRPLLALLLHRRSPPWMRRTTRQGGRVLLHPHRGWLPARSLPARSSRCCWNLHIWRWRVVVPVLHFRSSTADRFPSLVHDFETSSFLSQACMPSPQRRD